MKGNQSGKAEIRGMMVPTDVGKKDIKRCPHGQGIRLQFGFMQQEDQKEEDY